MRVLPVMIITGGAFVALSFSQAFALDGPTQTRSDQQPVGPQSDNDGTPSNTALLSSTDNSSTPSDEESNSSAKALSPTAA